MNIWDQYTLLKAEMKDGSAFSSRLSVSISRRNPLLSQTNAPMRSLRQVAEIHLGEIFAWFKVYAMEIRVKRLLG